MFEGILMARIQLTSLLYITLTLLAIAYNQLINQTFGLIKMKCSDDSQQGCPTVASKRVTGESLLVLLSLANFLGVWPTV